VLEDSEPVLWGHEPIYRDGNPVGFTTSGSYGHTLNAAVGIGYVSGEEPVVSRAWVEAGSYEIDIAGDRYAARAHWRAPYDPDRKRILA
jgi:4-methylaminobutanoate oxidase (formaldehyde-forming)